MHRKVEYCPVVSKKEAAKGIFDIWIENEYIAKLARPGQFLHIRCPGSFLRRPISICDKDGKRVRFLFEVRGEGTRNLAKLKVGDVLDIIGPQGRGFTPQKGGSMIVGGGIGIFPLLLLARMLDNPQIYLGFRTKELITLEGEFKQVSDSVFICTDDGSYGYHGLVTDLAAQSINDVDTVYACGPIPMLKIVHKVALENKKDVQISIEQRMGCGVGACLCCVCKTKDGYERVCQKGPVFYGDEVVFL